MARIHVRIIGECVIAIGTRHLTPDAPQLFALLLYLAEESGRAIRRTELIELLFAPDKPLRVSSHNLRQLLYRLSRLGVPLTLHHRTVALDAAHVSHAALEAFKGSFADRKARLKRTYSVLPHYEPPFGGRLSIWIETLRDRLHNDVRRQLSEEIDAARQRADWRYVDILSRRTLEIDPLNETAILGLAEATALSGSKALALAQLAQYRNELGDESSPLALPAKLLTKRLEQCTAHVPVATPSHMALVGRAEEIALLLSEWQRVRGCLFRSVSILGDKSVGKSRLAAELGSVVSLHATGHVLSTVVAYVDRARPLSLIADLAVRLLALPGAAGCDPVSQSVLARLSRSISPVGPLSAAHSHPTFEFTSVRNAFCDLLQSVSEERPILCIVDNADDLDDGSRSLLTALPARLSDHRVMLVTCEARNRPSLFSGATHSTAITLAPLSSSASRELLEAITAAKSLSLSEQSADWCLDLAGGNPGYLELILTYERQNWHQPSIPPDLVTATDHRIRELPLHAQFALQAIAVIGHSVTPAHIRDLAGLGTHDLLRALQALEDASFIVLHAEGLQCRTAFIAERSRNLASSIVLSAMEGRAASILEAEHSVNRWTPAIAWRIAAHWQNAHQTTRARAYLRACWQHAISIGQPMSAVLPIRDALMTAREPEARAALLDDLIGALHAAGDLHAASIAVAERRTLSALVRDSTPRRAQLAFDEDEARVTHLSTPSLHIEALKAHATSVNLDSHRRLRAARLLIMAADGELDEKLASETTASTESIATDNSLSLLLRSQIPLIFHTVFGNPDTALNIAADIERQVQMVERSWYTFIAKRNCSLARQLVGTGSANYEDLERSYYEALDASMIADALQSASHLTSILIDDGNLADARKWMKICKGLADVGPVQSVPIDYLSAQVDLALLDGDNRHAASYLAQMQHNAPRYASARLRNDLLIYQLRVRQVCGGEAISAEELQTLLVFHTLARRYGRHDDHMDVLWVALSSLGESAKASSLLSEYLRDFRRERRSCRYFLRMRTQSDFAWSDLTPPRGDD
jgi:DNA-binding SARP family transcriptional activator